MCNVCCALCIRVCVRVCLCVLVRVFACAYTCVVLVEETQITRQMVYVAYVYFQLRLR